LIDARQQESVMHAPTIFRNVRQGVLGLLAGAMLCAGTTAQAGDYLRIPAGTLVSVLSGGSSENLPVPVASFAMRTMPVTTGEFFAFLDKHPEWRRGEAPPIFADSSYLTAYEDRKLRAATVDRPVTSVSWYAAQAYCESEQARLPTWYEWEYVAAADEKQADARKNPLWRAKILSWYSQSTSNTPPNVGGTPNFYGVRNMHGLIWEWVDDFGALLVSADSRDQGDPEKLQYCGAGAISLQDRENYAILMRVALLSALNASDTTNSLGFRCAQP
jgi:formylglycine-generating enzyme required for sulfatase activity